MPKEVMTKAKVDAKRGYVVPEITMEFLQDRIWDLSMTVHRLDQQIDTLNEQIMDLRKKDTDAMTVKTLLIELFDELGVRIGK